MSQKENTFSDRSLDQQRLFDEMKEDNDRLNEENQKLQKLNSELQETNDHLKQENEFLRSHEIDSSFQTALDLNKTIQTLQSKNRILQKEKGKLENENETMKNILDKNESKIQKIRPKSSKKLTRQPHSTQSINLRIDSMNSSLFQYERENRHLKNENKTLNRTVQMLRRRVELTEAVNDNLIIEIQTMRDSRQRIQTKIKSSRKIAKASFQRKRRIDELREMIAAFKNKVKLMEEQDNLKFEELKSIVLKNDDSSNSVKLWNNLFAVINSQVVERNENLKQLESLKTQQIKQLPKSLKSESSAFSKEFITCRTKLNQRISILFSKNQEELNQTVEIIEGKEYSFPHFRSLILLMVMLHRIRDCKRTDQYFPTLDSTYFTQNITQSYSSRIKQYIRSQHEIVSVNLEEDFDI